MSDLLAFCHKVPLLFQTFAVCPVPSKLQLCGNWLKWSNSETLGLHYRKPCTTHDRTQGEKT